MVTLASRRRVLERRLVREQSRGRGLEGRPVRVERGRIGLGRVHEEDVRLLVDVVVEQRLWLVGKVGRRGLERGGIDRLWLVGEVSGRGLVRGGIDRL